jgi:phage repressor protein C with HTH and peptisase S24 domain/predicted XRE-type DNA-binding protein
MTRHIEALENKFGKDVIAKYYANEDDIEYTEIGKAGVIELKRLIGDYDLTQKSMAEIMNTTQSEVSQLCKGNRRFMKKHIDALVAHFGQEVIDSYTTPDKPFEGITQTAEVTLLTPEVVAEIKEEVREEIEEVESFPVLPEDVTTSPNTDVLKYVEENGSELETINPNQLLLGAKVDVAERIKRTSMLPTFQPEDTVFIRFIKDKMKIVDGETYYLDCKNRPTMIRLVKFEPDGKLRLIAKNSQYGDIVIERSDVINIGVVVALFRMTFGDQYSELEALRREKEAEREKKDTQIDKMLEMMDKQAEQQTKLIDYITKDK